ncbi:MAG: E3 binding domain-containing protein [Alkalispirochaeta sp.]
MATSIIMPKTGMAMETGTIIEWNVSVGDRIEVGDEILEIETDKVAMPVEAETSGYLLATLAKPGDVVPVTETIGWIGEQGEEIPESESDSDTAADATRETSPEHEPGAESSAVAEPSVGAKAAAGSSESASRGSRPERVGERVKATPAARRRADELGVDLSQLSASGPDGDVRARDVEAAATDGGAHSAVAAAGTGPSTGVTPLARQEARRAGLSLDGVQGTGPGGAASNAGTWWNRLRWSPNPRW